MSSEVIQEMLFQDPIGMRLRRGREQAGLTIEQVGQQLRLPVARERVRQATGRDLLGEAIRSIPGLGAMLGGA